MRTINAFRNFITSFAGQLLYMLLSFAARTVFIYVLGEEYLGINGLFSSVLSVLSFTELGIGTAITFELYKPIAEKNNEKIRSLMLFYKRAYIGVGTVVLVAGLVVLPFLPYLIKGGTDLVNVRTVYLIYLGNNVVSYWFFSYKQSLLYCLQQNYINSIYSAVLNLGTTVLKIVLLLVLARKNPVVGFYVYTIIGLAAGIVTNFVIKLKAEKLYPELIEKGAAPLTKEEKNHIFKNVAGLVVSNISGIALSAGDNILISAFISVGTVGIYGNYLTLKDYINKLLNTLFGSIAAGIGDICAGEDQEKKEHFFKVIQFVYFWIYGFVAISLWCLYNSFIGGVWLRDSKWLLPDMAVLLISLNVLLDGLNGAVYKYRIACGLHWEVKYRYLASAAFNVVVSYILMGPCGLGITGVLLGTTASIVIMISFDPYILYKTVFKKSSRRYYLSYMGYLGLVLATGAVATVACSFFKDYTFAAFLVRMVICMIVPNAIWYLLFRRSPYYRYLMDTVRNLAGKKLKRKTAAT